MTETTPSSSSSAEDVAPLLTTVADELHVLAHSLGGIGHQAIGIHLHRTAAAIDQAFAAPEGWWSSAFNGQEGRSRLFLQLLERLQPIAVVETGTFRGTTTAFIASHFAGRVLTCEIDPRWYLTARAALAAYPNVAVHQADSRALLRAVLAEAPTGLLFYYLDAHWQRDLPLREEIELILSYGQPAVIMIDDFAVPSDPDYHYDDYGPGKTLSIALLAGIAPRAAALFFPTLPAHEETGARRGCAVIGVGNIVTTVLAELAALQPHDWPEVADVVTQPTPDPEPDQAAALAPLQRLVRAQRIATELDAVSTRAAEAEARAERYRAELIEVGARAETATAQLKRLRGEVEALRASTSWRITEPLRRIRRLLG